MIYGNIHTMWTSFLRQYSHAEVKRYTGKRIRENMRINTAEIALEMRIINCKSYARIVLCLSENLFNQNILEYQKKCIKLMASVQNPDIYINTHSDGNVTHLYGARTENELQVRQPIEVKGTNVVIVKVPNQKLTNKQCVNAQSL